MPRELTPAEGRGRLASTDFPLEHKLVALHLKDERLSVIEKLTTRNVQWAHQAMRRTRNRFAARFRTITMDSGIGFHGYEGVDAATGVSFYFATPYHSWERETNENINGLIRQYHPKGCCFKDLTQADCDRVAKELNE